MNLTRWCGGCAADTVFDRFDCLDHGADCVEWVCSVCGGGVEDAPFQLPGVGVVRARRRTA